MDSYLIWDIRDTWTFDRRQGKLWFAFVVLVDFWCPSGFVSCIISHGAMRKMSVVRELSFLLEDTLVVFVVFPLEQSRGVGRRIWSMIYLYWVLLSPDLRPKSANRIPHREALLRRQLSRNFLTLPQREWPHSSYCRKIPESGCYDGGFPDVRRLQWGDSRLGVTMIPFTYSFPETSMRDFQRWFFLVLLSFDVNLMRYLCRPQKWS